MCLIIAVDMEWICWNTTNDNVNDKVKDKVNDKVKDKVDRVQGKVKDTQEQQSIILFCCHICKCTQVIYNDLTT